MTENPKTLADLLSNRSDLGPQERGIHRPQAHRPIGAVPHAAIDDQDDNPVDHPEGIGSRHSLFSEGESAQREASFRGDDCQGQCGQNDILRSRDRESDGWLSEAGKRAGFLEATPKGWVYSLSPPPCHVV